MSAVLEDAYAKTLDCVHCGLCLPACPTYELLSSEVDSPRGRIHLMRAVAERRLDPGLPELLPPIQRCLGCRACESACPSGVRYGSMLEGMRELLLQQGGFKARVLGRLLDWGLARRGSHRRLVGLLYLLQRTGLLALLQRLPLPAALESGLRLLPRVPRAAERAPIRPGVYEPTGAPRAEVGLFTGCLMETFFGRVNRSLLFVLRQNGCRVHVPGGQVCCGALHLHGGFRQAALRLVEQNMTAFGARLDAIVVDAAGCGAALKEYGAWHPGAAAFSARVRDMSEWLVELGTSPFQQALGCRVVYDDPCHLCHGQGISRQPRELLRAVPGLELLEVRNPGSCCGSAGIYNLTQSRLAAPILEEKLDALLAVHPDRVISANPGCMLQLAMGLRLRRQSVPVQHLAELLSEAYGRPLELP